MKTHELSKALTALARILRSSPNVELSDFDLSTPSPKSSFDKKDIPAALSMLAALSDFNKQQWLAIIEEYDFAIDVKNTDSVRDVMGKLLRYLATDSTARRSLAERARKGGTKTSPELAEALAILLK